MFALSVVPDWRCRRSLPSVQVVFIAQARVSLVTMRGRTLQFFFFSILSLEELDLFQPEVKQFSRQARSILFFDLRFTILTHCLHTSGFLRKAKSAKSSFRLAGQIPRPSIFSSSRWLIKAIFSIPWDAATPSLWNVYGGRVV